MLEVLLLALLGVATLVYLLVNRRYSYWQDRGVVQPPTQFGFGHFKDAYLGKLNNGLVIDKIYKSYPNNDAVGFYELLTPKLLVRSPQLIQKVMASDFSSFHDNEFYVLEKIDPHIYRDPFFLRGDNWKPGRSTLIPLLSQIRTKEIYPLMTECVTRMDEYVQQNLGKDLEAKEFATLFTMDVISSCVYGISSNCFSDPEAEFRKMGDIQTKDHMQSLWKINISLRLPKIRDLLGYTFMSKNVTKYIENMVSSVVDHRRRNNVSRNDLMQHMMNSVTDSNYNSLVATATVFFIEGFETSAMVASSALYEIAIHPKIQETLFEEISTSIGDKDIDLETLTNLPYFLDQIIQETMRKYPVMYTYQRICTKDTTWEIDGKSLEIKQGTPIWVPVYSIHNDPKYFPNPEVFDPERFNADNTASRTAYTYMPLGEGPRICVGSRLALTQMKLFLAHIVRKYKIVPTEKTPPPLTLDHGAWLVVPKEERRVQLEARK